MATKREDILALLDKAIGKKGPLRLPAYWMREVLLKIMDWAEGLTPDVDVDIDVPTKVSELENDAYYATQSYVNAKTTEVASKKQDTISDLSVIRSNAALGASAIQSVKSINGETISGSGDFLLTTKDETISNEKVIAAALNSLDERLKMFLQRIEILENNQS